MKIGDTVQITDETIRALESLNMKTLYATANIAIVLDEQYKNGICLDRPLYDIQYWNVADLELVDVVDVDTERKYEF